jgi:uncharacterized protein
MYSGEIRGREHLGTGISLPLRISPQGTIQLSSAEPNIEESIRIILRTDLGERVYRPDFGCRLSELAFAPLNTQTLRLIRLYVQEALDKWEPRIKVEEVLTDPDPVRGRIDIVLNYQVKDTYDSKSLVYPFYLAPSQNEVISSEFGIRNGGR